MLAKLAFPPPPLYHPPSLSPLPDTEDKTVHFLSVIRYTDAALNAVSTGRAQSDTTSKHDDLHWLTIFHLSEIYCLHSCKLPSKK